MTTLRKLPTIAPKAKPMTTVQPGSGSSTA
jgi:hypothetical protein